MRALLVVVMGTGCGGGVSLSVDRSEYALDPSGFEVRLALSNGTTQTVGYHLCAVWLERQEGEAWAQVPRQKICDASLPQLSALGSAASTERFEPNIAPGTYRVGTTILPPCDDSCRPHEIHSNSFRVVAPR